MRYLECVWIKGLGGKEKGGSIFIF